MTFKCADSETPIITVPRTFSYSLIPTLTLVPDRRDASKHHTYLELTTFPD